MISRLPVWLKLTSVNVLIVSSLTVALIVFAISTMEESVSERLLANQIQNLSVAAFLLERETGGTQVAKDPDGSVRRIELSEWPAFASEHGAEHGFIDQVGTITGETATIFAYDPAKNDFVRRTTNIIKDDGNRAVGTVLGHASAAMAPIMRGERFLGTAIILWGERDTIISDYSDTRAISSLVEAAEAA